MIEVVIPVGPGHETLVNRASESVRVAIDNHCQMPVRVTAIDDTNGFNGRSASRNEAVEKSEAEWIFFLDADDMMHPDAFRNAEAAMSDYEAIWGACRQMANGFVLERYELPRIRDYKTLVTHNPMSTIKIGHFVKRDVALSNPFNTNMDTGEDWDYYLRVWKAHKCIKLSDPFYIKVAGSHSQGPRSATGRQWNEAVDQILADARAEL